MLPSSKNALLSLTVAICLCACGGGGGGGSAGAPSGGGTSVSYINVSGVASSGFLNAAQISVYCGSTSGTLLGSTTSASDGSGSFTVQIPSTATCSGPILTVASSTAATSMVSKLGGTNALVNVGTGLTLSRYDSALPATGLNTIYVTPLSTLVVATAQQISTAGGGVTSQVFQLAVSTTTTALGLSPTILQAPPATLTQLAGGSVSNDQIVLYQLGAAVEQMAIGSASSLNGASLATALNSLRTTLSSAVTVNGGGAASSTTVLSAGSNTLVTFINQALAAVPTGTLPSGIAPIALQAPPTNTTVAQVSGATATGIAAAESLVASLKRDYLTLYTKAGTSGFLNTKASSIRADFKNGYASARALHYTVKAIARGHHLATKFSTAGVGDAGPYQDAIGTYYMDSHGMCRIYSQVVGTSAVTPYLIAIGGVTPAVCINVRWDLPWSFDPTTSDLIQSFEVIVVVPTSNGSLASSGASGTWTSWLGTGSLAGSDAFAAYNVSGQSVTQTGTYSTSGVTATATSSSGNFSAIGKIATFDANLAAGTNTAIPDVAQMNLSFAVATTGATPTGGSYTPTAGTISNLAGTIATLNSGFNVAISGGSASLDDSGGGLAAASGSLDLTATSASFQFGGSLTINEITTAVSGVQNYTGQFSGTVSAVSNGAVAATPFLTCKINDSLTSTPSATSGKPAIANTGTVSGTVSVATGENYSISLSESNTTPASYTFSLTYLDPQSIQVNVQGTRISATATSLAQTTGTLNSGDTTITFTSSTAGTVSSKAAGGIVGTYSAGTFTFNDGSYIVI